MKQRILSMFLVAVMVFTSVDITAFAQELNPAEVTTEPTLEFATEAIEESATEATEEPTAEPTEEPEEGEEVPTAEPTEAPTITPGAEPTAEVTDTPAVEETQAPSTEPTEEPAPVVTATSEAEPSQSPETEETEAPGEDPSATPKEEASATPEAEEPSATPEAEETPSASDVLASGECGDNLTWTLDNAGVLTISGTGDMYEYFFSDNKAPWWSYKENLKTLVMEEGITSIGHSAFYECSGFAGELKIPESVTRIGNYAFYNCSGFSGELTIPYGVTEIRQCAFNACQGFTGNLVIPESVTRIGNAAFSGTNFTGNLVLSDNLTDLGNGAFRECSGFTGPLIIPEGVTKIGGSTFHNCKGFTGDLIIPDGVTEIGSSAFVGCSGLTGKLVLPESLSVIEYNAFQGSKLTGNLVLPTNLTRIGSQAFWNCSGFTGDLIIPDNVTYIGGNAFNGCSGLNGTLVLPEYMEELGYSAFYGTDLAGELVLPKGITQIQGSTFEGCSRLTGNLIIPDSVTKIGSEAFKDCSGLNGKLVIPDSVIQIGEYAFYGCSGLNGNLNIPAGLTQIGDYAFRNCSGFTGELIIPDGVTAIEGIFGGCSGFTGNLVIPESVSVIGQSAFINCSGFTGNLIIPDGVTYIGGHAFKGCSGFTGDLVIPSNVTTIGYSAFEDCDNLSGMVYVPPSVTQILLHAFDFKSLRCIYGVTGSEAERFCTIGIADSMRGKFIPISMADGGEKNAIITVLDKDFMTPVSGAQVTVNGLSYVTDSDGSVKLDCIDTSAYIVISKKGYETNRMNLRLSAAVRNTIYLKQDIDFKVQMPEVEATIPLEHTAIVMDQEMKWLDIDYELLIGVSRNHNGMTQSIPVVISNDTKKKTIKVAFGVSQADESGTANQSAYNAMKSLCDGIYHSKSGKEVQRFLKKHGLKNNPGKMGVEVSTYILGYFEYNYETGELVESGGLVGVEGSGSLKWRPAFAGGIGYVKATLSLSAEGRDIVLIYNNANKKIELKAVLGLEQLVGIGGGVGGDNCHLEVGFEGGFEEEIKIPFESAAKSVSIALTGDLYFEAQVLALTVRPSFNIMDMQLYPWNGGQGMVESASDPGAMTFDVSQMTLLERNYLSSESVRSMSLEIESDSAYPDGTPQMVRLEDGTTLAVWITDNGSKSAENRTTLVYSVNSGTGWSSPQAVCETGRGDFYPSLSAEGKKAHLIWTNMGREFAEGTTPEEMLASTDIYYTSFENGAFSEPLLLTQTDNGTMELDAGITASEGRIAVAWLENSENDPFYGNGTTRIGLKQYEDGKWQETAYVVDGLVGVFGMDIAYTGDSLSIAYVKDTDGDIGTTEDGEVYLYQDGTVIGLTSDNKADRNLTFSEKGELYWLSDGEIVKMANDGLYTVTASGINGLSKFKVLENGTDNAIVFPLANGFKSELYLAEEKNGALEMPVQITECGEKIEDFALIYSDNKVVSGIVYETKVLSESEGSPYGTTALKVYESLSSSDIELTYVYADNEEIAAGGELPVTIQFVNNSSQAVNGLAVKIRKDDTLVVDTTASCTVKPGETGEVICNYPLGSEVSMHDITVEIQPADFTDHKQGNNSMTESVAPGDIAIRDAVITTTETGAELTGKIVNIGYGTTDSISFKVLKGGSEGEEVYTSTYGSLAAGAEAAFTYQIPESLLGYANENDGKYFYVVCDTQSEEADYGNNSEVLVALPTKVTGLTLKQEALELKVNEAASLTASVQPANAMNQKIYYTSDNSEIAMVTDDGTVIATGVGTAVIGAISADGGFSKLCIVTVIEREEEEVFYHLSTNKLSMEKGEEVKLLLLDEADNALSKEVAATVTWKSNNEAVAKVAKNGTVTAVSAGTAQISAVIEDTFYDVCMVEVSDKALQAIIFEEEKVELTEGATKSLTVLYVPEDTVTNKKLTYASDNRAVAVVNADGVVTAVGEGNATITATAQNGLTTQCRVVVSGLVRCTVTFDTLLGEEPMQLSGILYGETVALPQPPVRAGHEFLGWNTKADGSGSDFTAETTVTEDITVYAMWKSHVAKKVATAVPDIAGGSVVEKGTQVTLTCAEGAQIFYTLNGTTPTTASRLYQEPITINMDLEIRAIVVKEGYQNSDVAVFRYQINYGLEEERAEVLPEDIPENGIIPEGMWIAGIEEAYTYTGKAIKPDFRVYDHEKLLKAKTDYTISYKNNKKVSDASKPKTAPTITVTGKGNYSGTETVTFKILKKDIADTDITAPDITAAYNKKVQKKVPTVKRGSTSLKKDTDFTVSYPDLATNAAAYKAPGTYTILVKGKGGYTGQREVKLTITESKLMSKVTVSKIATQPYTGAAVTTATMAKAPNVKYGDKTKLKEGIHYTVSYENNINIGTATMILTGTDEETPEGTFTGTKKVTFKIGGTSLAKAAVTGVPKTMTYTGTAINEQTEGWGNPIKVVLNGDELTRAEDAESEGDYIVTFSKNTNKGTATVTIKGINAYSGSVKKEFTINAYNINDNPGGNATDNTKKNLVTEEMDADTVYAKGGSKPEPVVRFGETTLVKGKDYTLTYTNHTKWHDGTSTIKRPTVTITGKGNFKGTVKLTYTIAKQDIGNLTITASDVVYKKEKGAYKAAPVVKDLNNKNLKAKTDYTVSSYTYGQDVTLKNGTERKAGDAVGKNDIVPAGTLLKVAVTGKGNYTNDTPLVAEYRVVKSSIAKATVTVPSQPYTGKSITIEDKTKIKVKVGKTKLDPEDFEIVDGSFKNNTKAGTASFTIRGVGNYGGTKKVTFKIKPKGLIWWWR